MSASDASNLGPAAPPVHEVETWPESGVEMEWRRRIPCPVCGFPIGSVRGSKAAICTNCGFKDGCC